MSTPADEHPLEPGVHVQADVHPERRAKRLAKQLGARLCASAAEVEALLAEVEALPTAEGIELLRGLTARVVSAQRIVDRTVDRATAEVGERLAASGSGMAIHPSAVRDRAASVIAARRALETAVDAFHTAEAEVARQQEAAPVPVPTGLASPLPTSGASRVASFADEPPAPRRRRFFGLGRKDRERTAYEDDTSESTSLLQQMAAATDEAFGARRASAARDDHTVLLRVTRDRAQEDVRVAERAWRDLAGDDPVEDVESVVRRFDPQHQDAVIVAQDTVGVRAVTTLLQRAMERWTEGWRSLGLEPPDAPDKDAVEAMAARLVRPIVLVAGAVELADAVATALPGAAVLAVEPV